MKKVIISLICATSLLTVTSVNAAKVGFGVDQGFGVAAQFNNINAFIGNDGVSADYIFKQGSFAQEIPFNWYVGGGAFYDWNHHDEFGVRVPFGVTLPFAKQWDAFAQISPDLAYNDYHDDLKFGISAGIGIRYAF